MNEIIIPTDLDAVAERIRQRIRRTTLDIIETGKDLRLAKARLDHGQFVAWLEREFGMSPRSAQRFMIASEWAEDKSDTVSLLPPSTLYALSSKSTPEPIREQVVANLEAGKRVDPREVMERVKMAWADQRHAQHQKALRDNKNIRRSARYRERRELQERERQECHERKVAAATEIIGLLKKLPAEDFDRIRELMCDRETCSSPQVVKLLDDSKIPF